MAERIAKISVSELNLRKTASRLLKSALVSTEVSYLQRELGTTVTQVEMDAKVVAVRSMPWAKIVAAE